MFESLFPKAMFDSVWQVDLTRLQEWGIKALLIDLDNTLVEYRKYETSPQLEKWLSGVKQKGFSVCIVSNSSSRQKVASLATHLGIPAITNAGKPHRRSFRKAMEMLKSTAATTAIIGDQVFTDVLGGNRLGCATVLVKPLTRNEFFGTRLTRMIEYFVIKSLTKRLSSEQH